MKDSFGIKGLVNFRITRQDGTVEEFQRNNLFVQRGKEWVAGLMIKDSTGEPSFKMKIGTDNTPAENGDENLGTVVTSTQGVDSVVTSVRQTAGSNGVQHVADFVSYDAEIHEAGIFLSNGNMICRVTFSTITLAPEDTLQITWTLTVGG